jgi:hypothetical protein
MGPIPFKPDSKGTETGYARVFRLLVAASIKSSGRSELRPLGLEPDNKLLDPTVVDIVDDALLARMLAFAIASWVERTVDLRAFRGV